MGIVDLTEVANMKVGILGDFGDIFGRGKVKIKDDTKIRSRVCWCEYVKLEGDDG